MISQRISPWFFQKDKFTGKLVYRLHQHLAYTLWQNKQYPEARQHFLQSSDGEVNNNSLQNSANIESCCCIVMANFRAVARCWLNFIWRAVMAQSWISSSLRLSSNISASRKALPPPQLFLSVFFASIVLHMIHNYIMTWTDRHIQKSIQESGVVHPTPILCSISSGSSFFQSRFSLV